MERTSALDQPGVAQLKLVSGTDDFERKGTTQSISVSTLGECQANVARLTGRRGTKAETRRREPMNV